MKKQRISIGRVPALLWGEPAEKLYLSVHGQGGNKEEAIVLANRVCPMGYQVLSIDLPGHGERISEADIFDPWHCVPEIAEVMQFARQGWKKISLQAVSIGAWFSMQALPGEKLANCAFVSPIVDQDQIEKFAQKYSATLTIMKDGEHWFHTPEQMAFMEQWVELYVN